MAILKRKNNPSVFGEIKLVKIPISWNYFRIVGEGSFSTLAEKPDKSGSYNAHMFEKCREFFHQRKWNSHLLFCAAKTGRNVAKFIRRIETTLKVKPLTECGPTSDKRVMWVKISPWWLEDRIRKSLFTILLRAGRRYQGNFDEAVFSVWYTKRTKFAVKRFLSGHTKYTRYARNYGGWVTAFGKRLSETHEEWITRISQSLEK